MLVKYKKKIKKRKLPRLLAKKILIVKRVSRLVERSQSTKQMKRINNLYEQIISVAKALKNKSLTPEKIKQKIASWLGWAKHSNSRYLLHKILKEYEKSIL